MTTGGANLCLSMAMFVLKWSLFVFLFVCLARMTAFCNLHSVCHTLQYSCMILFVVFCFLSGFIVWFFSHFWLLFFFCLAHISHSLWDSPLCWSHTDCSSHLQLLTEMGKYLFVKVLSLWILMYTEGLFFCIFRGCLQANKFKFRSVLLFAGFVHCEYERCVLLIPSLFVRILTKTGRSF